MFSQLRLLKLQIPPSITSYLSLFFPRARLSIVTMPTIRFSRVSTGSWRRFPSHINFSASAMVFVFITVWLYRTFCFSRVHGLIGPPKRKRFPCLEPRIFPVIKCKPAFAERSAKGAAIGVFLEPQPFERAQKLGRHQFYNEPILVAVFLGR